MHRILTLGLALLMLILAGCSTEVTEYRQQQPALDIFHYFQGRTEAWGMVQDRNGKQLRRFHVEIDGAVVGETLTNEGVQQVDFLPVGGERSGDIVPAPGEQR